MTYHNHRSVKITYGILQYILRAHIEVIGRLIENQEVYRFKQKLYHGQTAPFTSREHFHLLVGCFSSKHESSENVAYLQTDVSYRHAVYRIKNGQILVEQLGLILGEVSNLYVMPDGKFSVERDFPHNAFDQRRFSLTVLSYKSHLLTPVDGKRHMLEHHMLSVCLAHVAAYHRIISATRCGRELQMKRGIVFLINFYGHNLLQLLDAALHLYGFCSLIAEALYEVFGILYLFLLVFVSTKLLLPAFFTELHKFVVGHLIVIYASA